MSGAHNTIVTARAGKDLMSSLASGLLTIVSIIHFRQSLKRRSAFSTQFYHFDPCTVYGLHLHTRIDALPCTIDKKRFMKYDMIDKSAQRTSHHLQITSHTDISLDIQTGNTSLGNIDHDFSFMSFIA